MLGLDCPYPACGEDVSADAELCLRDDGRIIRQGAYDTEEREEMDRLFNAPPRRARALSR